MVNWIRYIWHPNYGNYGGCYNSQWGKNPKDELDECFQRHDVNLKLAQAKMDGADRELYFDLRDLNVDKLGWYARAYRNVCMWIFKPKDLR